MSYKEDKQTQSQKQQEEAHRLYVESIAKKYVKGNFVYKASFNRETGTTETQRFLIIGGPYLTDPKKEEAKKKMGEHSLADIFTPLESFMTSLSNFMRRPPFIDVLDTKTNRVFKAANCNEYYTTEEAAVESTILTTMV